jgi:hypothetical protein
MRTERRLLLLLVEIVEIVEIAELDEVIGCWLCKWDAASAGTYYLRFREDRVLAVEASAAPSRSTFQYHAFAGIPKSP